MLLPLARAALVPMAGSALHNRAAEPAHWRLLRHDTRPFLFFTARITRLT